MDEDYERAVEEVTEKYVFQVILTPIYHFISIDLSADTRTIRLQTVIAATSNAFPQQRLLHIDVISDRRPILL